MKLLATTSACLAGWLAVSASAATNDDALAGNPYAAIVLRNVFSLNPPAPAPAIPQPEAPPPDKIAANGIMSILGRLQVLFKVTSNAQAGQPPKETSYILGEGERQDDIKVVQIDETAGQVTFNNHGIVQKILLPNAVASGGAPAIPKPYQPNMAGVIGSGRIPPYFGGGDDNAGQTSQIPRTKEQQILAIEALRAYYKSQHDPRADTLPPTAMTPPDAAEPPRSQPLGRFLQMFNAALVFRRGENVTNIG